MTDPTPISKWRRPTGSAEKKFLVWVTCPECGSELGVDRRAHSISVDGVLSPSMVCPYCPWHKWVRLEGWLP